MIIIISRKISCFVGKHMENMPDNVTKGRCKNYFLNTDFIASA